MSMDEKVERLREILRECGSVCIGYSGGVDSVFLAYMAVETLGADRVLAVTGRSAAYPAVQHDVALDCVRRFGIPHDEIETDELSDPDYTANPANRCYYCKSELWPKLQEVARQRGLRTVLDGSNADDAHDYRPGFTAAQEHSVRSPLLEAGLTKDDIRELSRQRGLPTWDQPSAPCLSSRLPYGVAVTPARLRQVEDAETILRDMGFVVFRVRHHDDVLRIEVAPDELPAAERQAARIAGAFHAAALPQPLLDAEGYRRGALNEVLVRIGGSSDPAPAGASGHHARGGGDVALPEHEAAGHHRDICVLAGCSTAGARELAAAARTAGFRYVAIPLDPALRDSAAGAACA
ncbi:MAG TPA: ATP-dependent sacrificial sulfur transferase LarE [Longimicrobiales bacterium]|nr:ATP-dependent sacrificial sulfur transferase LarE [Longimicrobiales bacterium]